jgi:hypothetical protein
MAAVLKALFVALFDILFGWRRRRAQSADARQAGKVEGAVSEVASSHAAAVEAVRETVPSEPTVEDLNEAGKSY